MVDRERRGLNGLLGFPTSSVVSARDGPCEEKGELGSEDMGEST